MYLINENYCTDLHLGIWANGHLGNWATGHPGIWATGHLGIWASGQVGIRASGHLGNWASGHLGNWASGQLGIWATGQLGIWASGQLSIWASGFCVRPRHDVATPSFRLYPPIRGGYVKNDDEDDEAWFVIGSEKLLQICKTVNLSEYIQKSQIKFAGHVIRSSNDNYNKQLVFNADHNHRTGHKIPNLIREATKIELKKDDTSAVDQFCREHRQKRIEDERREEQEEKLTNRLQEEEEFQI